MPRSARLKNIASGLCGSFTSRNNDVGGYWAIGKLRLLAEDHGQSMVTLDMLALSMQPASTEFVPVLARYGRRMATLAKASGIRLEDIAAAYITVDFAPPPWPRGIYYQRHWGEQFVIVVAISADGKADGVARHEGYCRPHDPASERRSCRPSVCATAAALGR